MFCSPSSIFGYLGSCGLWNWRWRGGEMEEGGIRKETRRFFFFFLVKEFKVFCNCLGLRTSVAMGASLDSQARKGRQTYPDSWSDDCDGGSDISIYYIYVYNKTGTIGSLILSSYGQLLAGVSVICEMKPIQKHRLLFSSFTSPFFNVSFLQLIFYVKIATGHS